MLTALVMSSTALAAESNTATTAGLVIGRLLFFVLSGLLLFFGLRRRSASRQDPSGPPKGNGLIIAGSVILGLSVLSLAAQSGMAR